jgi:hypothetical protein
MAEKKRAGYGGPERRKDCAENCGFALMALNSVPRWAFISSLSTVVTLAVIFAGWHVMSLKEMDVQIKEGIAHHEKEMDLRLAENGLKYIQDVERFIRAVGENRVAIREVDHQIGIINVRQAKIEAKQDLVLEKVGLTNGD